MFNILRQCFLLFRSYIPRIKKGSLYFTNKSPLHLDVQCYILLKLARKILNFSFCFHIPFGKGLGPSFELVEFFFLKMICAKFCFKLAQLLWRRRRYCEMFTLRTTTTITTITEMDTFRSEKPTSTLVSGSLKLIHHLTNQYNIHQSLIYI